MARQGQRRKRKRRGTQAGTVRPSRRSRGRSRTAKTPEQKRQERLDSPPTWRRAIGRALLTAGFLFVLFAFVLGRDISEAVRFAVLATAIYVPAFFMVDSILYRRRQRIKARQRADSDG
jgi:hypothetical protein